MKALAFTLAVAAAGLAGCSGGKPSPLYNERETPLPPGEGMLGDALTFNSKERQAHAAEQEDFKKWRESSGQAERQEFEEWRAWQEWKRKNPK